MKKTNEQIAGGWLLFWTLFIGVGAVAGAAGMIADPTGKAMKMDAMLPYFQALPFADILFRDYLFSGFALLIVNGLTNLTAAGFLMAKKKIGVALGTVFGGTLMLWICIQFYMFPLNFMSTAYFIFGLFQVIAGYCAWVSGKQAEFYSEQPSFPNVGKDATQLVVFFSRTGYVKRIAMEEADRIGAEVLELKTVDKCQGTCGFWWCGRFGMHRWEMKLQDYFKDFSQYRQITIVSPIWVFALSSPVRQFCKKESGKIANYRLVLVHFTKGKYPKAEKEVATLLGKNPVSCRNITCRFGKQIGKVLPK